IHTQSPSDSKNLKDTGPGISENTLGSRAGRQRFPPGAAPGRPCFTLLAPRVTRGRCRGRPLASARQAPALLFFTLVCMRPIRKVHSDPLNPIPRQESSDSPSPFREYTWLLEPVGSPPLIDRWPLSRSWGRRLSSLLLAGPVPS